MADGTATKTKKKQANAFDIMKHVVAGSLPEYAKSYNITHGTAHAALEMLRQMPKVKTDALEAMAAELTATTGPRGKVGAKIGESRTYTVQNWNVKEDKPKAPILVLPLSMYDAAGKEDAKVVAKFEKERIVIHFE